MGKLLAINISKERGTEKREVPQAELVADFGIMGDALAHPLVYGTMRMALLAYLRHLQDSISYAKACSKR